MKDWKTTIFGAGGLLFMLGRTLVAQFDNDPSTVADWGTLCYASFVALSALFAADRK